LCGSIGRIQYITLTKGYNIIYILVPCVSNETWCIKRCFVFGCVGAFTVKMELSNLVSCLVVEGRCLLSSSFDFIRYIISYLFTGFFPPKIVTPAMVLESLFFVFRCPKDMYNIILIFSATSFKPSMYHCS